MKKLSIVIPVRNEEEVIEETIQKLVDVLEKNNIFYEVVIVNDYSTDNTKSVLSHLSAKNNNIKIVDNYLKQGFG